MCATVVYLFLAGLALYITVTAVAFSTLPVWQAILVSVGCFIAEVLMGRYLVKRFVRRMSGMARAALDIYGQVLKGSAVDVHHVRAPSAGLQLPGGQRVAAESAAGRTYEIEFTLFPPDLAVEWEPDGLVFVAAGAPAPTLLGGSQSDAIEVSNIQLIEGDDGAPVEGPITGVRRLRVTLTVPDAVTKLAIRYGLAEFGTIDLTRLTPTTGRDL